MRSALSLLVLLLGNPALADDTPDTIPLPPAASVVHVEHWDYASVEIRYKDHMFPRGEAWDVSMKGDFQRADWAPILAKAGWEIVLPDRLLAHKKNAAGRDVWLSGGPLRYHLVVEKDAPPFALPQPAQDAETLAKDTDVPYLAPLPSSKRIGWGANDHIDFTNITEKEPRLLGPGVALYYEGVPTLSALEIQTRYENALRAAGWAILSDGSVVVGHYAKNGRDVWVKVTPTGPKYTIQIVDQGALDAAKELEDRLIKDGHVAIYGIYFDLDKADLRPESEAALQQILKLLAADPKLVLEIQGHTDSSGAHDHNQQLSDARAASVAKWLAEHGVDAKRLTSRGYAETVPVADNKTAEGRARNRRVELARVK